MSISSSTIDSLLASADEILTGARTKRKVAGFGIGIVYKDKVSYTRGYGLADIAQERVVTPETIFRTYSISKTLTAIGLMQLWEQGAFQLDDPVKRYLKAISLEPPTAHDPPITFRHLLTHTAGLGIPLRWQRNTLEARAGDPIPPLSKYFAGGLRAEVPAGSTFSYSNRGFAVLGQLIEDISGELYTQYMHRHVLEPLGMIQSDYVRSDRVATQMAQGYRLSRGKLIPTAYHEVPLKASGGLLSNVNDMTKYVLALLNGGSNEHGTILRPETLQFMLQRYYEADERLPTAMGLAFRLDRIGTHRVAYHSGGETGFLSSMFIAPDDGLGVIILSNTQVEMPYQPEFIVRTLLSDLWETGRIARMTTTFQKPEVAETPQLWPLLRGYYGVPPWKDFTVNTAIWAGMGGEVEVFVKDDHLMLRGLAGSQRKGVRLYPTSADDPLLFHGFDGYQEFFVAFRRNARNEVDSICGNLYRLNKRPRTQSLHFWTGIVSGGLAGASLLLGFVVWRKLQRLARENRKSFYNRTSFHRFLW